MLDDADSAVTANDNVGTWHDQSGNGNDFVYDFVTTRCPNYKDSIQNGLPMLLYNGTTDYLICNALAAYMDGEDAQTTIAMVFKKTGNTGGDTLWAAGHTTTTTPFNLLQTNAATGYRVYKRDDAAAISAQSGGTPDTNAHLVVCRQNGTTVDVWLDGTQILTAAAQNVGVLTLDTLALGVWKHTGLQDYLEGYIGEFVMYEGATSNGNISLLQTGLRARWNI